MTVRDVLEFKVQPGRESEIVALFKEATDLIVSRGGPRARLFYNFVGGKDFLTRHVVIDHEDLVAWARQENGASPEWLAMRSKVFGPDAPWTVVSRSLLVEEQLD
jgi:hypothetical protein